MVHYGLPQLRRDGLVQPPASRVDLDVFLKLLQLWPGNFVVVVFAIGGAPLVASRVDAEDAAIGLGPLHLLTPEDLVACSASPFLAVRTRLCQLDSFFPVCVGTLTACLASEMSAVLSGSLEYLVLLILMWRRVSGERSEYVDKQSKEQQNG
ncbi:hypothetical protein IWX50DRAFT_369432 [Phyllosticta citricarpa]